MTKNLVLGMMNPSFDKQDASRSLACEVPGFIGGEVPDQGAWGANPVESMLTRFLFDMWHARCFPPNPQRGLREEQFSPRPPTIKLGAKNPKSLMEEPPLFSKNEMHRSA